MQQMSSCPPSRRADCPLVRSIGLGDLRYALAKGLEDFRAMPTHVIFLSLIYPIAGIALWRATFGYDVVPLLYPLAAGFALIGPFAAIGLYELSRRRELGLDTSWKHAFDIIHSPSIWALAALGLFLLAIFGVWLAVANGIYVANFGYRQPTSLAEFADMVLGTPEGHRLIVVGNVVGFLFAVLAFALSVVSFPLLLDRNVGVPVAIATSVRAILKNPVTMILWGIIVAVGLVRGFAAVLLRAGRGDAGARACDLAPVSQGGRAGFEPAARIPPTAEGTALRGGFPLLAVRADLAQGSAIAHTALCARLPMHLRHGRACLHSDWFRVSRPSNPAASARALDRVLDAGNPRNKSEGRQVPA